VGLSVNASDIIQLLPYLGNFKLYVEFDSRIR